MSKNRISPERREIMQERRRADKERTLSRRQDRIRKTYERGI